MSPVDEPVDNPVEELLKRQGLAATDLEWSRVSVGHFPPDGAPVGAWTPMQSHRRVLEAVARLIGQAMRGDHWREHIWARQISDAQALLAEILR